jgi:signal transduction histidine kinase/DNA-binding response OmpR family regulator
MNSDSKVTLPAPAAQQAIESSTDRVQKLLRQVVAAEAILPIVRTRLYKFICLFIGTAQLAFTAVGGYRYWQLGGALYQWAIPALGAIALFTFSWRARKSSDVPAKEAFLFTVTILLIQAMALLANSYLALYFCYPMIVLFYLIQDYKVARWCAAAMACAAMLPFIGQSVDFPVLLRVIFTVAVTSILMDMLMRNVTQMAFTFSQAAKALRSLTGALLSDNARLDEAAAQAHASSRAKSDFVANVSHEIRTPMNAILGMLKLLHSTELTPRQLDYAEKTEGAAKSLMGLLNDILDYSKVEAGKMTIDPQPFRLDRFIRDLSVILSANVGGRAIDLLFDIDPALPDVLTGDAMRLQQVLINLGGNALKFTSQGQVLLVMRSQAIRQAGTVTEALIDFEVQDTGIGIAPENQVKIFDGFSQAETSTSRRFGGTGLGLAISKRLIEAMGGTLQVESALGKGSRFYFTLALPVVQDVPVELTQAVRAGTAPKNVLVVDDNKIACQIMVRMMSSWGWQARAVNSGAETIELLQSQAVGSHCPFDAICLDWQMPSMDGWETAREIRRLCERFAGPKPALIMVAANGREMLSHRSADEQNWLTGFISKPVTASILFDALMETPTAQSRLRSAERKTKTKQLIGMRVLLVEDNLINQQVASELLTAEGALVTLAENGQFALDALADPTAHFDVVLMDIQMPVMDGYTATRAIRARPGMARLPIIAMTANAMPADREACLAAGMNDHVGKPFEMPQLVSVLVRMTALTKPQVQLPDKAPSRVDPPELDIDAIAATVGVDLAAALERMGNMQDLYRRMLQTFVSDLQTMPDQLQVFARSQVQGGGPTDDAKRLLHTLKGLAATMGATVLSTEAATAEKVMAASPTGEQALAATAQACKAIAMALPGLQTLLDALQQRQADLR